MRLESISARIDKVVWEINGGHPLASKGRWRRRHNNSVLLTHLEHARMIFTYIAVKDMQTDDCTERYLAWCEDIRDHEIYVSDFSLEIEVRNILMCLHLELKAIADGTPATLRAVYNSTVEYLENSIESTNSRDVLLRCRRLLRQVKTYKLVVGAFDDCLLSKHELEAWRESTKCLLNDNTIRKSTHIANRTVIDFILYTFTCICDWLDTLSVQSGIYSY